MIALWILFWTYVGIAVFVYVGAVVQAPWLLLKGLWTMWLWPISVAQVLWYDFRNRSTTTILPKR